MALAVRSSNPPGSWCVRREKIDEDRFWIAEWDVPLGGLRHLSANRAPAPAAATGRICAAAAARDDDLPRWFGHCGERDVPHAAAAAAAAGPAGADG